MAWEPFLGPRLKIERADRHISDLSLVVTKFLERDPYRAVVEGKPDCSYDCVTLRAKERLPNRISTIVGDAVHNLRTALDHLAGDLVALNAGNRNDVAFPFCNQASDLEEMIKKRNMHRAATDVIDAIRTLKPYRGGNDALRAIHDLDIIDKHVLLLPIGYVGGIDGLMYKTENKATNTVNIVVHGMGHTWSGPLDDGAEMVRLPEGHNLKIGQEFKATIAIAFADGQPFEREPIIPALHQFSDLVTGIIKSFESRCLGA